MACRASVSYDCHHPTTPTHVDDSDFSCAHVNIGRRFLSVCRVTVVCLPEQVAVIIQAHFLVMVSLTELIATLRQIFDNDDVNVAEVMHRMESYKSNPADWRQFAVFDPHK